MFDLEELDIFETCMAKHLHINHRCVEVDEQDVDGKESTEGRDEEKEQEE